MSYANEASIDKREEHRRDHTAESERRKVAGGEQTFCVGNRHQVLPHFIHTYDVVKTSEKKITQGIKQPSENHLPSIKKSFQSPESRIAREGINSENSNFNVTLVSQSDTRKQREDTRAKRHEGVSDLSDDNSSANIKDYKTERKEKKISKIDRSHLRKGKWTVEEEEYTSRIIHQFSTGLLILPEGATLRSYIAEKLQCDPMRITKKYAGASCLGKRAYPFCDRTQATFGDIELAKTELAHLEHRFRLRVEHGQCGAPIPSSALTSAMSREAVKLTSVPSYPVPGAFPTTWLQSFASQMSMQAPGNVQYATAQSQNGHYHILPQGAWTFIPANTPQQSPLSSTGTETGTASSTDAVNLAWVQAAASLTPALSQLAAANLQQLQNSYEMQLQAYSKHSQQSEPKHQFPAVSIAAPPSGIVFATKNSDPTVTNSPLVMTSSPTSIMMSNSSVVPSPLPIAPQPNKNETRNQMSSTVTPVTVQIRPRPSPSIASSEKATPNLSETKDEKNSSRPIRTKDEEDAGSMLIGFLSSLHKGFLEAKSLKDKEEHESASRDLLWLNHVEVNPGLNDRLDSSSGRTSHPADSSQEDTNSELGGKDPSSSEESDTTTDRSRGPPRKRHKGKISKFTCQNVAEHTSRMDAIHLAEKHESTQVSCGIMNSQSSTSLY